MSQSNPLTVAVVGATGVVGRTMVRVLGERGFPIGELRLLASGRSAGRTVQVDGRSIEIRRRRRTPSRASTSRCSAPAADISKRPRARRRRRAARPSSTTRRAWRMDPSVPLVVSQVNPDDLARTRGSSRTRTAPRCSWRRVLMALRDSVGIERVVVDTYQSVSRHRRRGRSPSSRGRSAPTSPASRRRPASTRTRSRSTRSRRSTSSSTTATRRRSGRSSRRAGRSSTCRTSGSRARRCACPCS